MTDHVALLATSEHEGEESAKTCIFNSWASWKSETPYFQACAEVTRNYTDDDGVEGVLRLQNILQVGSLSPGIEVWDMDVLDAVEPVITLGGELPGSSAAAPEQEAEQDAGTAAKKQKKSKVPILA